MIRPLKESVAVRYSKVYQQDGFKFRYNYKLAELEVLDGTEVIDSMGLSSGDWDESPRYWIDQYMSNFESEFDLADLEDEFGYLNESEELEPLILDEDDFDVVDGDGNRPPVKRRGMTGGSRKEIDNTYYFRSPLMVTTTSDYDDYEVGDGSELVNRGIENQLLNALYDEFKELDLAEYIDEKYNSVIYGKIKSIKVTAELTSDHRSMIGVAVVEANEELDDETIMALKEYISGQYSDGWGEGFEQRPISEYNDTVEFENEEYDEETGETEYNTEYETGHFETCVSFWYGHDQLPRSPWSLKLS